MLTSRNNLSNMWLWIVYWVEVGTISFSHGGSKFVDTLLWHLWKNCTCHINSSNAIFDSKNHWSGKSNKVLVLRTLTLEHNRRDFLRMNIQKVTLDADTGLLFHHDRRHDQLSSIHSATFPNLAFSLKQLNKILNIFMTSTTKLRNQRNYWYYIYNNWHKFKNVQLQPSVCTQWDNSNARKILSHVLGR